MNRELDAELCRKYPHVFVDRRADMRTTAMCWGFECGDGWYNLLDKAAAELELLIVEHIKKHPYQNRFPSWIFSRYNCSVVFQWRCYSFLAVWEWIMVGLGLRQPEPWWPHASQIKEKYGTLRFYMTSGTDAMYAVTDRAEDESTITCETCGKKGKLRGQGWLYTRCAPCWKKEQYEN